MRLRSQSDDREFSVFMRINEAFQENFSIGLEYSPSDERGSFCLLVVTDLTESLSGPRQNLIFGIIFTEQRLRTSKED